MWIAAASGGALAADRVDAGALAPGAVVGNGTAVVGFSADPWPALGWGSEPEVDGTDGTGADTGGAGTDGRGTDGTGTDGTGTAGVVTAGVETADGTLTVPAGVGTFTDGADRVTEATVVLGTESASAATEASAIATSTLSASARGMRIVRDMCAETHALSKTCANSRA